MFHECQIIRTMKITHGSLSTRTGKIAETGSSVETRPCGGPLFADVRRESGVCRSCADGWEVEGNRFADVGERSKAQAAPKSRGQ